MSYSYIFFCRVIITQWLITRQLFTHTYVCLSIKFFFCRVKFTQGTISRGEFLSLWGRSRHLKTHRLKRFQGMVLTFSKHAQFLTYAGKIPHKILTGNRFTLYILVAMRQPVPAKNSSPKTVPRVFLCRVYVIYTGKSHIKKDFPVGPFYAREFAKPFTQLDFQNSLA